MIWIHLVGTIDELQVTWLKAWHPSAHFCSEMSTRNPVCCRRAANWLPENEAFDRSMNKKEDGGGASSRNAAKNKVCRTSAQRLRVRWQTLGTLSFCSLAVTSLSLMLFSQSSLRILGTNRGHHGHQGSWKGQAVPEWFRTRAIPPLILKYIDVHNRATANPQSSNSRFLVHEIPCNETQLTDTFLGLVSSFMLAVVTDRALLVKWTEDWKTPLDQLSTFNTLGNKEGSRAGDLEVGYSGSSTQPLNLRYLNYEGLFDDDVSGSSSMPYNETQASEIRRVDLKDALLEPGVHWDYRTIREKYKQRSRTSASSLVNWDPMKNFEALTCHDLKLALGDENKFIKVIDSRSYFMPLILINPFYSDQLHLDFEGGLGWAFADMFNFIVRPVQEVTTGIERFKERYMDGNMVIAMELSIQPGRGDWKGDSLMPLQQQNMFFETAAQVLAERQSQVAEEASNTHFPSLGETEEGVVFLTVTDTPAQIQSRVHELESANKVSGAGVVAILSANGDGNERIYLQLQELWILGFSDVVITTPGSRLGIVGTARTHKSPLVVVGESSAQQSTAPYPCFANFGAVQHTTCFVPSMLSKIPGDPTIPC